MGMKYWNPFFTLCSASLSFRNCLNGSSGKNVSFISDFSLCPNGLGALKLTCCPVFGEPITPTNPKKLEKNRGNLIRRRE